MHSEEIKKSLAEKGFSAGEIEEAVVELHRLGVLNDKDYARMFVTAEERRHKSPRQILAKARMKGLPLSDVRECLSPEDETMNALIKKKYSVLLDTKASYQEKQKARAALYRRGFYGRTSYGDSDSCSSDECGSC